MVTTKPIVAGDQIVSSDSPLLRSFLELSFSGTHTENFQIPNCFDDTATSMCSIYQEASEVTPETWLRFRQMFSFPL